MFDCSERNVGGLGASLFHSAFYPFFVGAVFLRFAPARQLSARKATGLA
jgi:hypothetical protein